MQKRKFTQNNKGAAAIEMAFILPILILIVAAVIEFGIYFLKSQAASRAVSTASIAIQQSISNGVVNDGTIKLTMEKNGLGMMDLGKLPNFVCAKSYADATVADSSSCGAGDWDTTAPSGVAVGATYYVAVRAFAVHTPLTPLRAISGAFPPDIDQRVVVPIGSATTQTHGIRVFDSGSGSWTVPDGVTQIKASIIGGGGGGVNTTNNDGGGGGGGTIVAYIKNLSSGDSLSYSIGAKGNDTNGQSASYGNGGSTTFNGITAGGGGGTNNGCPNMSCGRAGGVANTSQSANYGTISSIAGFPGTIGSGYYGCGAPAAVSNYGRGGGTNFCSGTGGAVIIEW